MEDKLELSMYLLFGSLYENSNKHAGLCDVRIQINKGGDEDEKVIGPKKNVIEPIVTYDKKIGYPLTYFASVPALGSIYFLLSTEIYEGSRRFFWTYEDNPVHMSIFGKITPGEGVTTDYPLPSTSKMFPFAATVGNKVYFLSVPFDYLLEPSFEAYDINTQKSEALYTPPFYKGWDKDIVKDWCGCLSPKNPTGFAVFKDFILVCLGRPYAVEGYRMFSYNTISGKWKPISCHNNNNNDRGEGEQGYHIWKGEAIVFGNKIYGYLFKDPGLVSYSCTVDASAGGEYDLRLDPPTIMQGYDPPLLCRIGVQETSILIAKIKEDEEGLFCVIQTTYDYQKLPSLKQPVFVSIIRISNCPGICTTLGTIQLDLAQFPHAMISACLVMQPEVNSSM